VKDGKVSLEAVPERWMKHAIEDVADHCSGVQDIENNIRVQPQPHEGAHGSGTPGSEPH
jgi:osmotically-inducible protein OsmY